jgi:hypothetical protein
MRIPLFCSIVRPLLFYAAKPISADIEFAEQADCNVLGLEQFWMREFYYSHQATSGKWILAA